MQLWEKKILLTKLFIIIKYIKTFNSQMNHLFINNMIILNALPFINNNVLLSIKKEFRMLIEEVDNWWKTFHTITFNETPFV